MQIDKIDVERFAADNRFALADPTDVLAFHERVKRYDMFGFAVEVVVDYVPFDKAERFYKQEFRDAVSAGEEDAPPAPDLLRNVRGFLDYMSFAWEKATHQRGISAMRSVVKLSVHMAGLSRPDLADVLLDEGRYEPYGAPALIEVCDALGITVPDGVRAFAKGEAFEPHYQHKLGGGIEVRTHNPE